jgi:hypothetical protein
VRVDWSFTRAITHLVVVDPAGGAVYLEVGGLDDDAGRT